MTTLEKILYVADYMEPNRDFDGVDPGAEEQSDGDDKNGQDHQRLEQAVAKFSFPVQAGYPGPELPPPEDRLYGAKPGL